MEPFKRLDPGDTFQFRCHPDIDCFNACCCDLNQFLTPYDIVRLKNRLGLSSSQFLKKHTVSHIGPRSGLPVVALRMPEEEDFKCPFVGPDGCTVYEDRPGACRIYPLGRIAVRKPGEDACSEAYFLIREPHCHGFGEAKRWTVKGWEKDQNLTIYNEMNDLMTEILSLKKRLRPGPLSQEHADLFHMACYDLDRFRGFALEHGLLTVSRKKNSPQEGENVLDGDDVRLMKVAIAWIQESLFGVGPSA